MYNIDGKFQSDGTGIFNIKSGERIPDDEPRFLLRARDILAVNTLLHYADACKQEGCSTPHIQGVLDAITKFGAYAWDNPEKVKEPGSSLRNKLAGNAESD